MTLDPISAMPSARQILVIDDHEKIGRLYKMLLKRSVWSDVKIDHALTLDDALEMLSSAPYDLILIDNRMPPHFDVRPALHDLGARNIDTPIILCTGLIPDDFGSAEEDQWIDEVWEKDDVDGAFLADKLTRRFGEPANRRVA